MRALLVLSLIALSVPAAAQVRLPHRTLPYNQACPGFQQTRCAPDDDPRRLLFNASPPVLERTSNGPLYNRFLGRVFRQPYATGSIGRYCNISDASTPFLGEDIDSDSADGSFEYTYRLMSNLGAGAEADLVNAATAAGLPAAATQNVRAAARAAYNRQRNRRVSTRGIMKVVRFKSDVVQELMYGSNPRFQPCRALLRSDPALGMVKAMSVFHIQDASSTTNIDEQIAADIRASLSGVGSANIGAVNTAIERTVEKQIQTALGDRYIVWAVTWLKHGDR